MAYNYLIIFIWSLNIIFVINIYFSKAIGLFVFIKICVFVSSIDQNIKNAVILKV